MIIEVALLALASTIRPTSLAAVYAILAQESRRTLMLAYVAAGLAFTVVFGLIVVYAFDGIHVSSGSDEAKAVAYLIGGAAALLFGGALLTGHVRSAREAHDAPALPSRWRSRLDGHLTFRTALLAGPATHVPGLFYLIALNVIVAHNPSVPGGSLAVASYNAIWFALPLLALVMCIVRPGEAREAVGSVERWARDHARGLMLGVSFAVGTALVVRGLLTV